MRAMPRLVYQIYTERPSGSVIFARTLPMTSLRALPGPQQPFRRPTPEVPCMALALNIPEFQVFRGTEPPRFASQAELECAKVLDYYGIPWEYEPTTFVLEEAEDGRVLEAFSPDFYLPEQDLYVEITLMKQSLVTRKNRKLRKLRERYPDVKIKLFYKRDLERLAQHFHLDLAS
jgi:hypoxanthine phosphoribosyltransferase